ncbi:MAG: GNAT family N-acetyltransferase [Oscillospiraceae bacterium]|nr:GNAT family N-acetyltransferase [Oscillospiraceae bacterium]MBR2889931.1 GNAT family N-acetyltransferase [Oscillospiraceae bacterium]
MNLLWYDYCPETMQYVESWLDAEAVRSTGLEEGFSSFYEYWAEEDGFTVGESFWCKVVCQEETPFAVIAYCLHESKILIMEVVVAPEKRGQGLGTKLLKALIARDEISGTAIQKWEAVIFLSNRASQRAFASAGFRYHHTHQDGDAVYYVYERGQKEMANQ